MAGLLVQRAGDDAVQLRRQARRRRPWRRLVQVGEQRRRHGAARKRWLAGQRGEQHAAQRVDVRARVDALAVQLLWRRVVDAPEPLPSLGQVRTGAEPARQTEVAQVRVLFLAAAGEQHVAGLDVAVHEPRGVRRIERRAGLRDDRRRPLGGQPPRPLDERVQVAAAHVAHDDVQLAVLLPGRVHGDDVRMIERRRQPRLALEALPKPRIGGPVGRDHLQRNGPPEVELQRPVDDTHAASPERGLDSAAGEDVTRGELGHPSILIGSAS